MADLSQVRVSGTFSYTMTKKKPIVKYGRQSEAFWGKKSKAFKSDERGWKTIAKRK